MLAAGETREARPRRFLNMSKKKKTTADTAYLAGYIPATTKIDGSQPSTSLTNLNQSAYSLNSEQIAAQAGAIDATATIYTVPRGYTLFVTSFNLQVIKYTSTAGVQGRGKVLLNGQTVMRIYSPITEGESAIIGVSFASPYVLFEANTVQVVSETANGLSQAGFTGFLVKNEDLIYK